MYDPVIDGELLEFGVSGWLYQSTMMLYDQKTLSLWSQIGSVAVSGARRGTPIAKLPGHDTTWGAWRAAHPDTLVLSTNTGYERAYGINMYYGLQSRGADAGPTVAVSHMDDRLPPQTQVIGIETGGATKAYPIPALRSAPETFTDTVGGRPIHITNIPAGVHFTARTADGEELPQVNVYWYAWAAFHPDTQVYATPAETGVQPQNDSSLVRN